MHCLSPKPIEIRTMLGDYGTDHYHTIEMYSKSQEALLGDHSGTASAFDTMASWILVEGDLNDGPVAA